MSARRVGAAVMATLVVAAAAWAGHWWWRATHPLIPARAPDGWIPAVVVAAGQRHSLAEPFGVALGPDGSIVVSEGGEAPGIRRVTPDGETTWLAGGRQRGFADGTGVAAQFDTPSHLAIGPDGTLYIADTGNHAIRRVTAEGVVTTIAGDGSPGGGQGQQARLNGPVGVAVGTDGGLVVADTYNDRIVRIVESADGWTATPLAGSGAPGLADGAGTSASFDTPAAVAGLADGSVVVADTGNDALRRIGPDGSVETISTVDPAGSTDLLWRPVGVAAAPDGRMYVTDSRARVVEIVPGGSRRTLAGAQPGFAGGLGAAALMREPSGIAVSSAGRVVVADTLNGLVRVLDLPERLGAWPPPPPGLAAGFDLRHFARVPLLWPVDPQEGPHEVAGTMGEPRGNPGGDGRERFHAGVDVRADQGAAVRAVREGTVTSVLPSGSFGTLSEFLSVGPITYVHIRVGRDRTDTPVAPWAAVIADPVSGTPARLRVRRGTHIASGEVIGSVNRFHHVHLNVGPAGEEANALLVGLPNLVDTVPPVIAPGGITLTDLGGHPLTERTRRRVVVTGPVRIIVDAYDRMDDSPPRRRLGLYRIGYQVLRADAKPAQPAAPPHTAIAFDRLPPAPDAPPALYAPGSGIPFYGTRATRFRYLVTSGVVGGAVVEMPWEPRLPPGDYVIRITAEDAAGNVATTGRDLAITIIGAP